MNRIALVVVVVLCGCPNQTSSGPDAGAPSGLAKVVDAGFVLTPEMIDAYLKYQRSSVNVVYGVDGGLASPLERAQIDERVRVEAGLTEFQATRIDEMVAAVIARRMVGQLAANRAPPDPGTLSQLTPEQRKLMQEAMTQFQLAQKSANELADERRRYGSQNIDVLLTRETDLLKGWHEQMSGKPVQR